MMCNEPLEDISYYRLKQTDFNGDFTYSNIVPVKYLKLKDENKGTINLFPNPVNRGETVKIEFENLSNKEVLVILRDIKGNDLFSKVVFDVVDGVLAIVSIDRNLPKGNYLVIASSDDQIYSQKLVVK